MILIEAQLLPGWILEHWSAPLPVFAARAHDLLHAEGLMLGGLYG
jgi:hypothetical protein